MTEEDLKKAMAEADRKMWTMMQMPPVVGIRDDTVCILSKDPAMQGYSDSKLVVTDITYGVNSKRRMVAVREPDGVLRTATNEEKDRMNQIYAPINGREVYTPRMFQPEHLEVYPYVRSNVLHLTINEMQNDIFYHHKLYLFLQPILDRGDYEFILNRACIQFEPDHPDYHRVTHATYDRIDELMHYDVLRSTRHFGPMVFYLAWNKKIDRLLQESVKTERMRDAALVIELYYILHPSENVIEEKDPVKLIQHYIKTEVGSKRELDFALKSYVELEEERRKIKESIDKAHGKTESSEGIKT